jgi:hypothetical protein
MEQDEKPKIIFAEEARAIRAQTQCVNKSAYPTEERAQRYAQASADRAQKEMTIYECDLCGKWHMSSKFIPPKWLNGRPPAQQIVFPRKPK